ncbi:lytic transglycosylase domain-containing protein [Notoacmeibacter ruber]|uniref:Lytic transglycosylase domain-containing protein n=1 Tax=Notoacmeibacter ruber TaxID=2670375 RepID=A0A3L7JF31_9HYPH|nr:transglycosylase SLT domain-containing protein [Notoacmeibacter ruber]RLQ88191.1 lytic transglycosylase domain-containing protein [Notoacmeibacter ruber]
MSKATVATVAFIAAALMSASVHAETAEKKLPGVTHFAKAFEGKSSLASKTLSEALEKGVDGPAEKATSVDHKFSSIINREAKKQGVPASLVKAVIEVESSYRPDVTGAAGEIGLMQIKPTTAQMMGFKGKTKDLYDPATNIRFGVAYLAKAHKLGGGSTCGTILKYNAGHGAKKMNPISKRYCEKIKRILGA